jgi:UDP-N-acetylglucosamine 2-epimerase (non-hydrolysing)
MKILVAFGTRPEIIKLAPVILELRKRPEIYRTSLLATAQHRGLLDQMLGIFGLEPDLDLNIMKPNQSLEALTTVLMKKVSRVLSEIKPDLLLIQGDTTTVMMAGLAAFYKRIPVGHIEAGLRTWDIYNPFPEEVNRRVISVLGTYHFAPTRGAARNLRREGIPPSRVFITGNTVVDALNYMGKKVEGRSLPVRLDPERRLILVTAHRRENFGKPFESICWALKEIAREHRDVEIVYPVHPNPNIKDTAERILSRVESVQLISPLNYLDFLGLMKKAYLILTDSGGVQEEAPTFQKPVLVLRKVTERPEGIKSGLARLVGTDKDKIVGETRRLLNDKKKYMEMAGRKNPYGDGKAARRIVAIIAKH